MSNSSSEKISCAIIGASGYTGEELVKLAARHPRIEITAMTSRQWAGKSAAECLGFFHSGKVPTFEDLDAAAVSSRAEVFFLALPHGVAAEYAVPLRQAGKTVIDLSADFRLKDPVVYEETYGKPHPAPDLLQEAVYGLVEWNRKALPTADLVACPGCYPTSVQLPLIPLLKAGLIGKGDIIVTAYSGISGAGKKSDSFYSFSERAESMTAYGLPFHRHVPEMEQELSCHAGHEIHLHFAPHLAPVIRGMMATISIPLESGIEACQACLEDAYREEAFVSVLPPGGRFPDTRQVRGTNRASIAAQPDLREGRAWLLSAIDNLGKGAAGQAIQAFNVRFGHPERCGLEGAGD
jgi:N-acetyl-gamma-glutamyl-phosphate reductase